MVRLLTLIALVLLGCGTTSKFATCRTCEYTMLKAQSLHTGLTLPINVPTKGIKYVPGDTLWIWTYEGRNMASSRSFAKTQTKLKNFEKVVIR